MADFTKECNNVIACVKSMPVSKQLFDKNNEVNSAHVSFLHGNDKNHSDVKSVYFVEAIKKIKSDARDFGTLRYTQKMLTRLSRNFDESVGNVNQVIPHIQKVVNEEKLTKAQVTVLLWDAVHCQFALDKKCGFKLETDYMLANSFMHDLQKHGVSGTGCFKKIFQSVQKRS